MDLGTTIIGVILVLICIIPIVIINSNRKKKDRLTVKALYEYAENNLCKIDYHDMWLNAAIGIDKDNKTLFFLKGNHKEHAIKKVDLQQIRACNVLPLDGMDKAERIDKLELALFPQSKNEPTILLEVYNSDISFQLANELMIARKWDRLINQMV